MENGVWKAGYDCAHGNIDAKGYPVGSKERAEYAQELLKGANNSIYGRGWRKACLDNGAVDPIQKAVDNVLVEIKTREHELQEEVDQLTKHLAKAKELLQHVQKHKDDGGLYALKWEISDFMQELKRNGNLKRGSKNA